MIISQSQVRRVLEYLQTTTDASASAASIKPEIAPEFVERVRRMLEDMPETRSDRVAHARQNLEAVTAQDVADKMIARIISDSLR